MASSKQRSQMLQSTKANKHNRSLMLKDYLMRDDLSSCSSNGFKSFPRRPCCSTVGFLVETNKDLKRHRKSGSRRKRRNTLPRSISSSSSCSSSKVSVLQRASEAVISAIKSLPGSKSKKAAAGGGGGVLSRSFSKKLLSRSFWKKAAKEEEEEEGGEGTQRWRTSFRELLMQDRDKTASLFDADSAFTAPSSGSATSSSSGSGGNSSWGESEFTLPSSAASSEGSAENDVVAVGAKEVVAPQHKTEEVTRDWANEEKEQLSPVSVLDCPFEDDHDQFNSTDNSTMEGSKHKHTQKRRHFESVASLEPVTLEKRMSLSEQEEDEPHDIEENARDLLNLVIKRTIQSNCLTVKAENLLFDYFKQNIGENKIDIGSKRKLHLCKVAEDWIRGEPKEVYSGWEVKEGREVYVREMDRCVEWRNSDQEVQQLALEMEKEVFISLVDELVLDLATF